MMVQFEHLRPAFLQGPRAFLQRPHCNCLRQARIGSVSASGLTTGRAVRLRSSFRGAWVASAHRARLMIHDSRESSNARRTFKSMIALSVSFLISERRLTMRAPNRRYWHGDDTGSRRGVARPHQSSGLGLWHDGQIEGLEALSAFAHYCNARLAFSRSWRHSTFGTSHVRCRAHPVRTGDGVRQLPDADKTCQCRVVMVTVRWPFSRGRFCPESADST